MLFWLSETGKIWGFQAFWSCSVNFPHYGDPLAWNWSYLGFLGIIWRTCGSKCQGEGGGIFPTVCVECCLVWMTSQIAYTFYQPHLCPLRNQLATYQLMTKQFSMSWSHWYRSIWWSYCTNFSLGNFCILLSLSNYQLDTDVSHSHILWLMFLCVPTKMYHYLARENFSHMKVEGWIRPMLLWERGQITIVNFLDHSELQIPQKTFVSVWQGIKLRRILKQLVYCYVIAQHGFHVKVCPMTCTLFFWNNKP